MVHHPLLQNIRTDCDLGYIQTRPKLKTGTALGETREDTLYTNMEKKLKFINLVAIFLWSSIRRYDLRSTYATKKVRTISMAKKPLTTLSMMKSVSGLYFRNPNSNGQNQAEYMTRRIRNNSQALKTNKKNINRLLSPLFTRSSLKQKKNKNKIYNTKKTDLFGNDPPISWIKRRNYESPKFGSLVDSRTQRWQQVAGEAVAAALQSEFVIAEPLQVEFSAGKRHDLLVQCSLFLPTATINLKTV